MEGFKEFLELAKANWPILKDIMAILGGSATVLGAVAAVLGFKRRWAESGAEKKKGREIQRVIDRDLAQDRAKWFTRLYNEHEATWGVSHIANMTIQEACGKSGWTLPGWAIDGWERVLVGDLNKRAKKRT